MTAAPGPADTMNPWRRLLAMAGFGLVAYWLFILLLLLAVIQFGFHLWSGEPNQRLGDLARQATAYLDGILAFLLYRTDGLPFPFQPLPGPGEDSPPEGAPLSGEPPSWRACLDHLLGHVLDGGGGGRRDVRAALRQGEEGVLARLQVRLWTRDGEAHVAFALSNPPLASVFLGTPWHGRAWGAALKRAPGAATGRIRLEDDGNPRHVLLLPLRLVLAEGPR